MIQNKILREDNECGLTYLLEGEKVYNRQKAIEALAKCKEMEKQRDEIPVWIDKNTTVMMDKKKIKRKKLEILKVKIGGGKLAYMERKTAIKNGFLTE